MALRQKRGWIVFLFSKFKVEFCLRVSYWARPAPHANTHIRYSPSVVHPACLQGPCITGPFCANGLHFKYKYKLLTDGGARTHALAVTEPQAPRSGGELICMTKFGSLSSAGRCRASKAIQRPSNHQEGPDRANNGIILDIL